MAGPGFGTGTGTGTALAPDRVGGRVDGRGHEHVSSSFSSSFSVGLTPGRVIVAVVAIAAVAIGFAWNGNGNAGTGTGTGAGTGASASGSACIPPPLPTHSAAVQLLWQSQPPSQSRAGSGSGSRSDPGSGSGSLVQVIQEHDMGLSILRAGCTVIGGSWLHQPSWMSRAGLDTIFAHNAIHVALALSIRPYARERTTEDPDPDSDPTLPAHVKSDPSSSSSSASSPSPSSSPFLSRTRYLLIGLGTGHVGRMLSHVGWSGDVVEYSADVVQAATDFFHFTPTGQVYIQDGYSLVYSWASQSASSSSSSSPSTSTSTSTSHHEPPCYPLIIHDVYDGTTQTRRLHTQQHFQALKQLMTCRADDTTGLASSCSSSSSSSSSSTSSPPAPPPRPPPPVLILNVLGIQTGRHAWLLRSYHITLLSVFSDCRVFTDSLTDTDTDTQPQPPQHDDVIANIIFVCSTQPLTWSFLSPSDLLYWFKSSRSLSNSNSYLPDMDMSDDDALDMIKSDRNSVPSLMTSLAELDTHWGTPAPAPALQQQQQQDPHPRIPSRDDGHGSVDWSLVRVITDTPSVAEMEQEMSVYEHIATTYSGVAPRMFPSIYPTGANNS